MMHRPTQEAPLWLSRARLRRGAGVGGLLYSLLPPDRGGQALGGHKLVWTLFGDAPDRPRDFLWREIRAGEYILLSARRPIDPHGIFDLDPPKAFHPSLAAGDLLSFQLRANATVARSTGEDRGARHDVGYDAVRRAAEEGGAADGRFAVVEAAGKRWLECQLAKAGAQIYGAARLLGHRVVEIPRAGAPHRPARFGVLDWEGRLVVDDPDRFLDALALGFGRGKAFGFGLMLVRRARHGARGRDG